MSFQQGIERAERRKRDERHLDVGVGLLVLHAPDRILATELNIAEPHGPSAEHELESLIKRRLLLDGVDVVRAAAGMERVAHEHDGFSLDAAETLGSSPAH